MLEFNTPATTAASSMLSMLNINMEASRQNFLLGNPPLAALHSMADMKPNGMASPYPSSQTLKPSPTCSSGTPHGINDILGRPVGAAPPTLGTTLGALPRLGLGMSAAGMYFGGPKLGLGDLPGRPHIYWPNVLQSQALWRDRFASAAGKSNSFHIHFLIYLINVFCAAKEKKNSFFIKVQLRARLRLPRALGQILFETPSPFMHLKKLFVNFNYSTFKSKS